MAAVEAVLEEERDDVDEGTGKSSRLRWAGTTPTSKGGGPPSPLRLPPAPSDDESGCESRGDEMVAPEEAAGRRWPADVSTPRI